MSRAAVLTTYERPLWLLWPCVKALREALPDDPIILVDDGSSEEYRDMAKSALDGVGLTWVETDTIKEHPGAFHRGGHNDPAHSTNVGLDVAKDLGADHVLLVSSDCIVQNTLGEWCAAMDQMADRFVCNTQAVNLADALVLCSTQRPRPFQWCQYFRREHAEAIEGFDIGFLRGLGYEDNDFSGRLIRHVGQALIDDRITTWHMHHPCVWFGNGDGEQANEAYCREKWGGTIPFNEQGRWVWGQIRQHEGVGFYTLRENNHETDEK